MTLLKVLLINIKIVMIELTFEKVPCQSLINLISYYVDKNSILEITCADKKFFSKDDITSVSFFESCLEKLEGNSIFFKIKNEELRFYSNDKIELYILKFENSFELSFLFESNKLKGNWIIELQNWGSVKSKILLTTLFYCGYEPSIDQETRFFSGIQLGPLGK